MRDFAIAALCLSIVSTAAAILSTIWRLIQTKSVQLPVTWRGLLYISDCANGVLSFGLILKLVQLNDISCKIASFIIHLGLLDCIFTLTAANVIYLFVESIRKSTILRRPSYYSCVLAVLVIPQKGIEMLLSIIPCLPRELFENDKDYLITCIPFRITGERGHDFTVFVYAAMWTALTISCIILVLNVVMTRRSHGNQIQATTTNDNHDLRRRYGKFLVFMSLFDHVVCMAALVFLTSFYFTAAVRATCDENVLPLVLSLVPFCHGCESLSANAVFNHIRREKISAPGKRIKKLELITTKVSGILYMKAQWENTSDTNDSHGLMKIYSPRLSSLWGREIVALGVLRNSPHPNTSACLWILDHNPYHESISHITGSTITPQSRITCVEWANLGTLRSVLADSYSPISDACAWRLAHGIVTGLKHLHSQAVYHHALDTTSIYIRGDFRTMDFQPIIGDFHESRITSFEANNSGNTMGGNCNSNVVTDTLSDIRSLGLIFIEIIACNTTARRFHKCSALSTDKIEFKPLTVDEENLCPEFEQQNPEIRGKSVAETDSCAGSDKRPFVLDVKSLPDVVKEGVKSSWENRRRDCHQRQEQSNRGIAGQIYSGNVGQASSSLNKYSHRGNGKSDNPMVNGVAGESWKRGNAASNVNAADNSEIGRTARLGSRKTQAQRTFSIRNNDVNSEIKTEITTMKNGKNRLSIDALSAKQTPSTRSATSLVAPAINAEEDNERLLSVVTPLTKVDQPNERRQVQKPRCIIRNIQPGDNLSGQVVNVDKLNKARDKMKKMLTNNYTYRQNSFSRHENGSFFASKYANISEQKPCLVTSVQKSQTSRVSLSVATVLSELRSGNNISDHVGSNDLCLPVVNQSHLQYNTNLRDLSNNIDGALQADKRLPVCHKHSKPSTGVHGSTTRNEYSSIVTSNKTTKHENLIDQCVQNKREVADDHGSLSNECISQNSTDNSFQNFNISDYDRISGFSSDHLIDIHQRDRSAENFVNVSPVTSQQTNAALAHADDRSKKNISTHSYKNLCITENSVAQSSTKQTRLDKVRHSELRGFNKRASVDVDKEIASYLPKDTSCGIVDRNNPDFTSEDSSFEYVLPHDINSSQVNTSFTIVGESTSYFGKIAQNHRNLFRPIDLPKDIALPKQYEQNIHTTYHQQTGNNTNRVTSVASPRNRNVSTFDIHQESDIDISQRKSRTDNSEGTRPSSVRKSGSFNTVSENVSRFHEFHGKPIRRTKTDVVNIFQKREVNKRELKASSTAMPLGFLELKSFSDNENDISVGIGDKFFKSAENVQKHRTTASSARQTEMAKDIADRFPAILYTDLIASTTENFDCLVERFKREDVSLFEEKTGGFLFCDNLHPLTIKRVGDGRLLVRKSVVVLMTKKSIWNVMLLMMSRKCWTQRQPPSIGQIHSQLSDIAERLDLLQSQT